MLCLIDEQRSIEPTQPCQINSACDVLRIATRMWRLQRRRTQIDTKLGVPSRTVANFNDVKCEIITKVIMCLVQYGASLDAATAGSSSNMTGPVDRGSLVVSR